MKTHWIKIVSLLVFALILLGFINIYPRLAIMTGYAAKTACTCRYVIGRDLDNIKSEDLYFSPVNSTKIQLDDLTKTVTATLYGLQKQRAQYREGLGCILLHGKDQYNTQYPNLPTSVTAIATPIKIDQNIRFKKPLDYVFKDSFKTRAVIIMHRDTILAEKYVNGIDKSTQLLGWSMTKSITNALIGIAINEGILTLEQDHLFEQWTDVSLQQITINDLLQMNSGISWVEDYGIISDITEMLFISEDMISDITDNPFNKKEWQYASGSTNLLMGILRKTFNDDDKYLSYPREKLFLPLGMNSAFIETDESGNFIGSSYGYANTRDWLKFGQFFLNNGITTKGDTLLPPNWVKYSYTPMSKEIPNYGAHWWLNHNQNKYKDVPADMYSANGFQGQFIFIIPSKELVIVRLGLANTFDKNLFISAIIKALPE